MDSKGIRRLHDKLLASGNQEVDSFLEEIIDDRSVSPEYVDRIQYLLAISDLLTHQKNNEGSYLYSHIGGYAVLTHLVDRFGDKIHKVWRTSHDLDIVFFDPRLLKLIEGDFEVLEKNNSHLRNKKSYMIKDPEVESQLELDAYIPDRKSGRILINKRDLRTLKDSLIQPLFYGIPVSVPAEYALLDLKLDVGVSEDHPTPSAPRAKDVQDIFDLLSIYSISHSIEDAVDDLTSKLSRKNLPRLREVLNNHQIDLTASERILGKDTYQHVFDSTKRLITKYLEKTKSLDE